MLRSASTTRRSPDRPIRRVWARRTIRSPPSRSRRRPGRTTNSVFWSGDYNRNILSHAKSGASTPSADYLEIGYDYKIEDQGIDLTVAFTYSDDLVLAQGSTGDYTVVFGIKKTFEPKKR